MEHDVSGHGLIMGQRMVGERMVMPLFDTARTVALLISPRMMCVCSKILQSAPFEAKEESLVRGPKPTGAFLVELPFSLRLRGGACPWRGPGYRGRYTDMPSIPPPPGTCTQTQCNC